VLMPEPGMDMISNLLILFALSKITKLLSMIYITSHISIDEREVQQEFIRSSGPGGQNVNKVATAVKLRFDVMNSRSLPDDVRRRLIRLAGRRMTEEGVLIIDARRFRTQERNRQDSIRRLVELIRKAAEKPKPRRRTKPTLASKRKRLENKRHRSVIKRMRRTVSGNEI
jgi:ribosome-associated protein